LKSTQDCNSQWRPFTTRNKLDQRPLLPLTKLFHHAPKQLDGIIVRETRNRRIGPQIVHVNGRLFAANHLAQLVLVKHAEPLVVYYFRQAVEKGPGLQSDAAVEFVLADQLNICAGSQPKSNVRKAMTVREIGLAS
jgi:hypothetical protein